MTFGNGGNGGSKDVLYFAAGLPGATNGLFGALSTARAELGGPGPDRAGRPGAGWRWKNRRRHAAP